MIEVQGLTKFYNERPAIQDLTFSVPKGQVLGFLGPNGAGKSTTMRILTGFLGMTAGSASIDGCDVSSRSREARRRVGYLPETAPLYNEMRVAGFLDLMCRLRGVPPSRRRARVDHAMEACGLEERRSEIIGRLSKGLRQRVGLAQAIVHDPKALILDEPTAGLDPAQTRATRTLIKQLGREHTVILSSHLLPEVAATCERVLIINEGRIVADDTPGRLTERFGSTRGQEIEMLLRGETTPAAIDSLLGAVEGVDEVVVMSEGDRLWRASVSGTSPGLREELTRAAVEGGLGVREVQARRLTLEDVFLSLTVEDGRAEPEEQE
ncbi:MAG TPA: ABC transporter ATP-binding protein [Candidatus Dormibacteraeota bacterium]|nr:ABC transporter ATP-binding protein [Candidatus Dormibacteraeota bacterium]